MEARMVHLVHLAQVEAILTLGGPTEGLWDGDTSVSELARVVALAEAGERAGLHLSRVRALLESRLAALRTEAVA